MKPTLKIRAIRFTIALLLSLPVVAARAANLWWDPVPGTAGPGDAVGNWGVNANNTNWWSSSANVPWNNANLDTAVVGFNTGTATTITLSNKVLVGGIIFSNVGSAAYTIAAASTTSIPLANATNILFTGVSPTVTLAAHDVTHAQVADVISASVIATNGLSVSANTGTTNGFLRFGNITNSIVGNLYVGTPGNAVYGGTGGLFCDMNTPTATDPYLSIANNLTNVTVYSNATFRISNHNSGSPANIVWPKRITMSGFGRNGINGAWVITGNVGDNFVTDLVLAGDSLIDINAGAANKVFTLYGVISGSGNLSVVSANSTANRHTLVLTNASTFVGNMNVGGGTTLQLIGGNNRLPATAAVALGMSSMPVATWNAYGRLVLGSASGVINQTIAGLSSDSSAPLCWVVGGNGTTASLLTVNSGASNFFAGSVGGTAVADKNIGIILTGGGTLTLAGTNSANGGFTASSGSIEFGDGFTDNPFSGNITNNSSVAFNVASSQTLAQLITGSGTVTKKGFGMLTLTGTNNYSGATTVSSGTLSLTTAKSGTGAINVGTGLELDIKRHVAGAKITAASATFDTDTVKMDFNLKGPNATPLLDVTGALMNTGTMNIYVQNAGILTVGSYALIKYSSFVDGGGSAFNLAAPISPRVTATINNNTITKTVELVVTAVDLMKWTGSTDNVWDTTTTNWMLTGASTPINYADGELIYFDDTGANPAINLTTSAFPGMMTLSNTTTTYSISGSGTLGGSGTLVKAGSGSLTLGIPGANQSGGTIVQGGTLTLGDGSTDCSVSASIENNSLLVFNVLSANNPSAISGTGSLTKQGAGDFTLDEANSYGGATTVTAGRVHVLDSTAFGSAASGTTVASGAEVWLDAGGLNVPEPLTIGGTGLGTAGALNIGVLMNSTWSGRITASADTLFTADLNSVLNLSDSVLGGANNLLFAAKPGAYFVASSNVTARGVFLGALPGDVAAGGLHLSGPNETLTNVQVQLPVASGATPPATAGLFARHNFALGTNSTVVLTNDQHIGDTGTRLSLDNNVTIPPGVKLVAWCPGAGAEGPGGYRCTLSVRTTTTNTWNGPIIIHGVDPSLSPTSLFTLFGGDSVGGGGLIVNGNITLGDGVANLLVRGFSGSGAINGVISLGTNFFATADGSPWTIGSTGNTWAETQIGGSGMALNVGQNNALCTSAPVRLATGSPANALDLQGHNQQVAGLYSLTGTGMTVRNSSTNSDSTLKVLSNAGSNWVYSGTIASVPAASPLHLDVAGDTLTLASAGNNYAGNTTIRSGATLALSGSGNITASPIIDVQAGGTFAVSGTTSGGWTAAAGQSVKGNGTITGNLGVSGTVAPGESVGALNVTGDVTMNGSGAIVMEVNNSAATNDLLNVSGTLAYGGTLLVTNISGTPYVNGQVIKLFNAGTYSGSFVNIIVPGASSYNASNLTVNGTITVSSASTGPVSITFSPTAGGTALDLSWPPDHIGWRLQNQTNSLNGAWSDVPGSTTTNHVIMPVVKVNPTVFFRLKSP